MELIRLDKSDLDEIVLLNKSAYSIELEEGRCPKQHYLDETKKIRWWLRLRGKKQEYFGLFEEDVLIGMIGYHQRVEVVTDHLFTLGAVVHPEHQGKRNYQVLREFIENIARDLGYKGVACSTLSKARSLPLLKKNGHEIHMHLPFYGFGSRKYNENTIYTLKKTFE